MAIIGFTVFCYLIRDVLRKFVFKGVRPFEDELKIAEKKSIREVNIVQRDLAVGYKKVKIEIGFLEKFVTGKHRKKR